MRKKLLQIGGILLALFVLVNAGWYIWRYVKYSSYSQNMEQTVFSNFVVPHYFSEDEDGFQFSVKYPDYLSLTGNLGVGMPIEDDNLFVDSLIIWPLLNGEYEIGALLYEENNSYQIYIDAQGRALDSAASEIVNRHEDNIEILLEKATNFLNIRN